MVNTSRSLNIPIAGTLERSMRHMPVETYSVKYVVDSTDSKFHYKWIKSLIGTTIRVSIAGLFSVATAWYSLTHLGAGPDSSDPIANQVEDLHYANEFQLREKIVSYGSLTENWDKDGAVAPHETVITDVLTFLDDRPADIPLPLPEIGIDGDVGIYWDFGDANIFAEVIFRGNGEYEYYAVMGTPNNISTDCGDEGVVGVSGWPADMIEILRGQSIG